MTADGLHPGQPWRLAATLMLALAMPSLQGCFVAATGAAVGTALMVDDRRGARQVLADQKLEMDVANIIQKRWGFDVHVNVVVYNRRALVTGEVPDAQVKGDIVAMVSGLAGVDKVYDELRVGPLASFESRNHDAYVSSRVKARLFDVPGVDPNHVKVFTEAGTVYLLGTVNSREAAAASEAARTTSGVKRVVRVFEYDESLTSRPRQGASGNMPGSFE